jgi:hypothetical protein
VATALWDKGLDKELVEEMDHDAQVRELRRRYRIKQDAG